MNGISIKLLKKNPYYMRISNVKEVLGTLRAMNFFTLEIISVIHSFKMIILFIIVIIYSHLCLLLDYKK